MKLTTKQYAKILDEALSKSEGAHGYSNIIKEFVALVSKDGKVSKMNDILSAFNGLWNKRHNSIDVTITTADGEAIKFPTHFGDKHTSVSTKKNPEILGGSIIKIGDYIIDTSIKSKINALR